ncbi:CDP-diacylglycerol--serine O-phosphatidyltransferase [Skermanella stibiiresistens SB22]|uniref:CDP-diacylglycerol--serine O-phosphatidyltransferase n=1 Tax=Skermanella stibiiresistens SB22 TaxID=1385369 RepID=W9GTC9_9PROT|nr:CDP-diacylglycerol--serine O-phosphatidyltransferase [Skermanella stibiiresistens]EWY37125.1 CDP-diacylglycerol--serine O-phosphatidyltransferase [Skermanella stibiiresistens SB22]
MNTRAERLRRRGNRPPRLRGLSINRLLPNMLTMLALCAGVTAMRFAIQGRFEAAVFSVMIAAVFDALDGRIARLLNGQSRFGEELDSLSDVVSFGVAPAITLYLWVLAGAGTPGWLAVLTFSVCAALRLARFNSKLGDSDLPPYAYNYFTGVPAPAAAGLVLLPLVISFEAGPTVFGHPFFVGLWAVVIALLMVSQWPTFSFKGIRVPQKYVIPLLAAVGIIAAMLVSTPWLTLAMIGIAYLISLPFSFRQYRRLRHEAELLHAEAQGGTGREPDRESGDPILP